MQQQFWLYILYTFLPIFLWSIAYRAMSAPKY